MVPSTVPFQELLRGYLQLYYLKPFDAVNDAANALSFQHFAWRQPICEVGTGDGAYSFIMQGGALRPSDDRYNQSNPKLKGDIYNTYEDALAPKVTRPVPPERRYALGIDGNPVHLRKCADFGLYDRLLEAPAERYADVADESFETVFLYVYHGLRDHEGTLRECARILRRSGELYFLAYSDSVRDAFPCHRLSALPGEQGAYFKAMDNGRYDELVSYSRSLPEWAALFSRLGLEIEETWTQVSPLAWTFYDVQSRPFLKQLISWDAQLRESGIKDRAKEALVERILPPLSEFSRLFATPRKLSDQRSTPDVFLTFRLRKR